MIILPSPLHPLSCTPSRTVTHSLIPLPLKLSSPHPRRILIPSNSSSHSYHPSRNQHILNSSNSSLHLRHPRPIQAVIAVSSLPWTTHTQKRPTLVERAGSVPHSSASSMEKWQDTSRLPNDDTTLAPMARRHPLLDSGTFVVLTTDPA